MALSEEDRREIREEIKSCFRQELHEQGMDLHSHARDHEFISAMRGGTCTIRKASIWTLTAVLLGGFLGLIWAVLTGEIKPG